MLDSWLTLWHWTRLFEKQLPGFEITAAFTYQKQRLDLILEQGSEAVQLAWLPFQNQTTFYISSHASLPRRHVAIFGQELNVGAVLSKITLHASLPLVRFQMENGAELLFDFRHPQGNVYLRKHGAIALQFLKSISGRPLEDHWYSSVQLQSEILHGSRLPPHLGKGVSNLESHHFTNLTWLKEHYQISGSDIGNKTEDLPEMIRLIVRKSGVKKTAGFADSIQKRARIVLKRWQRKLKKQQAELADNDWQAVQQQADGLAIAIATGIKTDKSGLIVLPSELSPSGYELSIVPDPKYSLQQNLERLYQQVRKIKSRSIEHAARLNQTETDIQNLTRLILSEDEPKLQQYLEQHGERFTQDTQSARVHLPYRSFTAPSGIPILVGRSARDNDVLTLKIASKNDWWFHARGVTGSHVILQTGKQVPHQQDLVMAAQLAARFSDAKHSGVVAVSYCQRKYISKPKGSAPGLVRVQREEVLTVEPFRLEGDS